MFGNQFMNGLGFLPLMSNGKSRAINAENPNGEKGKGGMAASHLGSSRKGSPCLRRLAPGSTTTLAEIEGTGVIQHIWITVSDKTEANNFTLLRDLVIKMYWEGEKEPSVESPLGDFFCNGFARDCIVNSLPIVVNPTRGMNSYFPMPFRKKARITIENQHEVEVPIFFYQIDYCLYDELPEETAYFHAQWKRERLTEKQNDYTILDGVKGKGHYVGVYMALTTLERYWWGEGEIKIYLDGDDKYPTICGTGTEDYFGGAWGFHEKDQYGNPIKTETTYCTPFMGYPFYSCIDNTKNLMHGMYRWHILDPIRFQHDLRVTIQQIGVCKRGLFERQDDVASVAYWYQTEPHHHFGPLMKKEDRWPR